MPRLVLPVETPTDAATGYAAGFLDGEGSIAVTTAGKYRFIYLTFVQSEPGIDALHFIRRHFGGSISRHNRAGSFRYNHDVWVLGIRSQGQVRRFLEAALPYLIVKRAKAEAALALLRENGRGGTFWLPEEDAVLREGYRRGSVAGIARRLGRTEQSVWARWKKLHRDQ